MDYPLNYLEFPLHKTSRQLVFSFIRDVMNDQWNLVVDVIRKRTQADVKSCEEETPNDLRDSPLEYTPQASRLLADALYTTYRRQ